ncbi:glyoxalase [Microlunatus panaciterrae]|uniref:Methylmalonyl-CoA/ethylmalonyl-CoA epimerase n=1 Tax=Microlunatus panaciterrae TaxID=400768 RepID=A0ABS2RJN1_9ACTN|nr:VOC family protein [Microlunatus panaciterrae]MBM7799215.1 methylmalonyl-CoA/ethylmalonyl-CoA epimerase [Microlunatus panaciterrae]
MKVLQVAQRAADLERAAAWYSDLLGVGPSAVFDPPGLVFFQVDGVRLLLDRGAPTALLYFEVPDVRDFARNWRERGGVVESEPHVIFSHADDALGPAGTDEWMAFVRDSEDNLVGLVSRAPSSG